MILFKSFNTFFQIVYLQPICIACISMLMTILTITPMYSQAANNQDSELAAAAVYFEGPEIALDIIKFYRYLAKNNLLPIRDYTVPNLPKGKWLADAMLDEGIIVRGRPEPELTYLLCDINPDNCTKKTNIAEPIFTYNKGQTIKVPNLSLESYEYYKALPSNASDSVLKEKAIVFGVSQKDLPQIAQGLSEKNDSTNILVKATGYSVRLKLPINDLSNDNSDLRKLTASPGMFVSQERSAKAYQNHGNNSVSSFPSPTENIADCSQSSQACEKALWDIMKYDASNNFQGSNNSVVVGVIDLGLDRTHFDFSETNQHDIFKSVEPTSTAQQSDTKHGTAVVGILAARKNMRGIIGLNPKATVVFYSGLKEDEIPSKLDKAVDDNVKILNMSIGYKTQQEQVGSDRFSRRLKEFSNQFLVVSAAGNDGINLDDDCGLRIPRCFYLRPNLLNVAALDKSGRFMLPKSNYGGDVVHIAAPGEDIITDMPNGNIGSFDDTSAAAAIVSGAASIVQQLAPNLEPDSVAQRLQYTADFLEPEQDGKLISGRLNLQRAVEYLNKDTLVSYGNNDDNSKLICGTIRPYTPYAKIRFFRQDETENQPPRYIFVRDVRRISKMPNNTYTIMGMYSDDSKKPKRLTKWSYVSFTPNGGSSLPTNEQIAFVKYPCSDNNTIDTRPTSGENSENLDLNNIIELTRHAGP